MHGLHLIRQKLENFCHLPLKGKALSCSVLYDGGATRLLPVAEEGRGASGCGR